MWMLFRPQPVEVQSHLVERGLFEEKFSVDGKLRSRNKAIVVAFANGDIDDVSFKAGDPIRKGQKVTTLHWDYHVQIKSPLTGVVSKVFRDSAGPINRGEPLIEVIDPEQIEIVAEVLTSDSARLREGISVEVSDIGDANTYSAVITSISRAGFIKISALGVEEERTEVRMNFVNLPAEVRHRLGDNYHVSLAMLLSRVEDVVKIPLGALFRDQGIWMVYVVERGRAKVRRVQVLARNDKEVAITEGLSPGDVVVLFPGDKVHEGVALKVSP